MKKKPNPFLQAALRRVKQGFMVFPCESNGKKPIVEEGRNAASNDAAMVNDFWKNHAPTANIGIATGPESGFFAVDVDTKEGINGKKSLAKLIAKHGNLPKTQSVITPNNGVHFYFEFSKDGRQIKNSAGKIAPGIDIRGKGGYVIGAGSKLKSGTYRYAKGCKPTDIGIAKAPGWLLDLVAVAEQTAPTTDAPATSEQSDATDEDASRTLRKEIARVEQAPKGTRNATLNDSSFRLGQLIGAGASNEEEVRAALASAASKSGLGPEEIAKTLDSGIAAGKNKPRDILLPKPVAQQLITANSDIPYVISQMLLERYAGGKHLLYSISLYFYKYTGTHWQKTDDNIIKSEILSIVVEFFKDTPVNKKQSFNTIKNEAFDLLKSVQVDKGDKLGKAEPLPIVNCLNGEIWTNDDGTWELRPHSPSSYQTHCLKVSYDPKSTCPRYKKALREIFRDSKFPKAMSRHFNELAGYIIQPRRHIPKIFFFKGEGDNGKGVLAETLQRLMGEDAVYPNGKAAMGYQHSYGNRFTRSRTRFQPVSAAAHCRKAFTSACARNRCNYHCCL